MRMCPKLHKPLNQDGTPRTRAIVGAGECMAARASEVIADAIDAFTENEVGIECDSTEDMIFKMNKAEEEIKKDEKKVEIIVGSADAVALYPSITKKVAGEEVFNMVVNSEVKLSNINYSEAAKYIATTCSRA